MSFNLQGNFQAPGGGPLANGSIVLSLSNPSATLIVGGGAATPTYTINLDANGNIPAGTTVNGNNELSPPGTFYIANLFTGPNGTGTPLGPQTWVVGPSAPYTGSLYPNVMVLPAVSFTGAVIIPKQAVSFSATPAFNAAIASRFTITLAGNVTSSTITGMVEGQLAIFEITQDGTGGRTFVWPTNVHNPQSPDPTAGARSIQAFVYDGTNFNPISEMTVN